MVTETEWWGPSLPHPFGPWKHTGIVTLGRDVDVLLSPSPGVWGVDGQK